jgi:NAD(P)-dependent dehydrogenase (short-subunit alcohol dehydrogenase family)
MDGKRGIALVTGAGTGIGRSSALHLAKAGWTVVLAGRRAELLDETASQAAPAPTLSVPTDLGQEDAVAKLFATIQAKFGRLDFVFNNAGTNAPGVLLEDLPVAKWKEIVDVNLTGVFLCTQAAFRMMKAQTPMGGRIVNNGSISAHTPRPDSAPYTATKHAVTGLTKSAALDGRKYNIAVGQIDIGNAATPMTTRMQKGVKQADGRIEVEPTMDVDEVGRMIVHMASLPPDANVQFVTIMATKMPFIGRG